jgi:hypothetical protein
VVDEIGRLPLRPDDEEEILLDLDAARLLLGRKLIELAATVPNPSSPNVTV